MGSGQTRQGVAKKLAEWLKWPEQLFEIAADKLRARAESRRLAEGAKPVRLRAEAVRELFALWAGSTVSHEASSALGRYASTAGRAAGETENVRDGGDDVKVAAANRECEEGDVEARGGGAAAVISGADPRSYGGGKTSAGDRAAESPAEEAGNAAGRQGETERPAFGARTMKWCGEERSLLYRIEFETERANRNNVTRTEAYRAVYFRRPELHWALLAHIVSRNGGWNMTDLKGELLPRLLTEDQTEATFRLLERCNALIFGDAYPQLLLYEAGRKAERDYSGLAAAFGVSAFMEPVWALFRKRRDSALLTTALIVNEQHVIERRVVQHPEYREHVLNKPSFKVQAVLQTNTVVLPYGVQAEAGMKLAGLVLEHFGDLRERIEFGKRLYAVLFGVPEVRSGALEFVRAVQHTGSRADYAPHLFTSVRSGKSRGLYKPRLKDGKLARGAKPLYSPKLGDAWPDRSVEPPRPGDWTRWAGPVESYFEELPLPPVFEVTDAHWLALAKIELAVAGAERLGWSK
ncbi:DUF2515 family protein [Paenibacillus humicola]|uniref:DUF2515 family protein n=1 Tax=Paenibacillus humicola TaxID=3110540 RepID=UPI00237C0101|nr:DUF2515 family protein [Paenibacillus humicola]